MPGTYSIARLVAWAYLSSRGMEELEPPFTCYEGTADIVAVDGQETVLVQCRAKRLRGEAGEPKYSKGTLQCYLVAHPECSRLRFDVVDVLIESDAMADVRCAERAFEWER